MPKFIRLAVMYVPVTIENHTEYECEHYVIYISGNIKSNREVRYTVIYHTLYAIIKKYKLYIFSGNVYKIHI